MEHFWVTPAQVFTCEFYKISQNNFITEHLRTTAFVKHNMHLWNECLKDRYIFLSPPQKKKKLLFNMTGYVPLYFILYGSCSVNR